MKLIFGALLCISVLFLNDAHACGENAGESYVGSYKVASQLANKNLICKYDELTSHGLIHMKNEKCGGWITYVTIDALNERFAVRDIKQKDRTDKYAIETIDQDSAPIVCKLAPEAPAGNLKALRNKPLENDRG